MNKSMRRNASYAHYLLALFLTWFKAELCTTVRVRHTPAMLGLLKNVIIFVKLLNVLMLTLWRQYYTKRLSNNLSQKEHVLENLLNEQQSVHAWWWYQTLGLIHIPWHCNGKQELVIPCLSAGLLVDKKQISLTVLFQGYKTGTQ